MNIEAKLLRALADAGIPPASGFMPVLDGRLHRFDIEGRARGKKHGWLLGRAIDGDGFGVFGDWVTGIRQKWCSRSEGEMSTAQRLAFHQRIQVVERAAMLEQKRASSKAAAKAASMLSKAGPVDRMHPYVRAKAITPYGAYQLRDLLLVPVVRDRTITSLQIISDRRKTFLSGGETKGGHLVLGRIKDASFVLMCEGWATGCSLHEATGYPVVVCFSAFNLIEVARRFARAVTGNVIICGDDDHATVGNPGKVAALKAANLIPNAKFVIPSFPMGATAP